MAKKPKILFVCTGNSARSQMAEGFVRYYASDKVRPDSAGTNPKGLNPLAVWVMNEAGVDIKHQTSDDLSEKNLSEFGHVVTLCGDARDLCPPLPDGSKSEHWPLTDPARFRGTVQERREAFRLSRNEIERRVKRLLQEVLA